MDIYSMMNRITIGNSFEILPELPDGCVDVVITDPMYNLKQEEKEFLHSQFLRISKTTILVFAPPENQWVDGASQHLFWMKPISTKNTSRRYSRFVEMIFVYDRGGAWNCDRHWSQYTNVFSDLVDDTSLHPFRKPPSLISRLVRNHTNPGDIILDPFAGSGVVADVAGQLGRNHISVEINKEYISPYMQIGEWL